MKAATGTIRNCIQVDYDENDPNILVVTVTYTDMLSNLSERG
jgi:hypothetical protein